MSRFTSADHVELLASALLGAVDVDGGPTDEQRRILQAVVTGCWGRPDLDVAALASLRPEVLAPVLTDRDDRDRVHQLLVLLELARHPLTVAQTERVETFCAAIGVGGEEVALVRDLVGRGADAARADYGRMLDGAQLQLEETSLRGHEPAGVLPTTRPWPHACAPSETCQRTRWATSSWPSTTATACASRVRTPAPRRSSCPTT